jgi:hypothetical protein
MTRGPLPDAPPSDSATDRERFRIGFHGRRRCETQSLRDSVLWQDLAKAHLGATDLRHRGRMTSWIWLVVTLIPAMARAAHYNLVLVRLVVRQADS